MNAKNENFSKLKPSYLFAQIEQRVNEFIKNNPHSDVIKMGIGDVTLPISQKVLEAGANAVYEMGDKATFRGYGPYEGYAFLREAISEYYARKNIKISPDEIFISDGAKTDTGAVLDLFSNDVPALMPDPVYPAYVDANLIAGRKLYYINGNKGNGFLPEPPKDIDCGIIYICSPNNPTGAAYDKAGLQKWVDYALSINAVILFDAAYEAFIGKKDAVSSIFEIEGARNCAIEIASFSKMAGFTGVRCGFTVIPKNSPYHAMYMRRQGAKYNGNSYIVQKMAHAALTLAYDDIINSIEYYKNNARIIAGTMDELKIYYTGGINSPYIWLECGCDSWDFFDRFLNEAQVVGTPGAGFGKNGEGWFRLTAFSTKEKTEQAMKRFKKFIKG